MTQHLICPRNSFGSCDLLIAIISLKKIAALENMIFSLLVISKYIEFGYNENDLQS